MEREDREPTADERAGIDWWNSLSERERADWLRRASSAKPADAWAEHKRISGNGKKWAPMTRSPAMSDDDRSKEVLKKLGVQETPERVNAVRGLMSVIRIDQRTTDVELCNKIAADVDGSLGEGGSDLAELARQCALAIETGDPGACDETQSEA